MSISLIRVWVKGGWKMSLLRNAIVISSIIMRVAVGLGGAFIAFTAIKNALKSKV